LESLLSISANMLLVGVVGFVTSANLGSWTRRGMSRNTVFFLAKVWGGIVVFGIVLGLIISA